tara:strand:- start:71 stop:379 length:309 start_codon:yes stop_codon:yes gene_type:complete
MIKNRQKNNSLKNIFPSNKHKKTGVLSTLGESMVLGAGLGVGSEAGHSIFKKVFSENKEQVYSNKNETNCIDILKMYEKCIISGDFNQDICKNIKNDFEKYC